MESETTKHLKTPTHIWQYALQLLWVKLMMEHSYYYFSVNNFYQVCMLH